LLNPCEKNIHPPRNGLIVTDGGVMQAKCRIGTSFANGPIPFFYICSGGTWFSMNGIGYPPPDCIPGNNGRMNPHELYHGDCNNAAVPKRVVKSFIMNMGTLVSDTSKVQVYCGKTS